MSYLLSRVAAWSTSRRLTRAALTPVIDRGDGPGPVRVRAAGLAAVGNQEKWTTQLARPNWEFIRVDVLMPDHPKIEELSDRAFRALITLWCYCGLHRNDGIVTAKRWRELPPKVRAELAERGLAEPMELGGAVMHDFVGPDGHQRSRDEIDELAERRKEIAVKAANARWGKERPPLCVTHMHQACVTHAPSML